MKIEPFKMRVTPEQSRRVQEIIFENGGKWRSGKTTVINTSFPCLAFELRGDGDGISAWSDPLAGSPTFSDAKVPEIMYYKFINKYERQMKQIKLEVGKTYLSREGKEVTIVGNNDRVEYPCTGNNGQWYTESGRYHYNVPESPYDLIEEVPEPRYAFTIPDDKEITVARYTLAIPDGMTKLTVEQVSNRIIVEMVPEAKEPKPGDIVFEDGRTMIIKKYPNLYHAMFYPNYGKLFINGLYGVPFTSARFRPATPEEAQPLWDALKKAGKRWNAETMQVEDVPEIERIREWVETRAAEGNYNHQQLCWLIDEYLKQKEDEK